MADVVQNLSGAASLRPFIFNGALIGIKAESCASAVAYICNDMVSVFVANSGRSLTSFLAGVAITPSLLEE